MKLDPVETFRKAAKLVAGDATRQGNVLHLGSPEQVILTGDLHGNTGNFARIHAYAESRNTMPVVLLQEIIHGPEDRDTGLDLSAKLLLYAAYWKIQHPDHVFFLMGNHDLAQVTRNEIQKEGRGVCAGFNEGVRHLFGDAAPEVYMAMMGLCRAMPLAARFDNRLWASHTLPYPNRMDQAGLDVLDRPYREEDLRRGGGVYEWTWGRDQSPEQLDELAEALDVDFFLLGHRHVQDGIMEIHHRAIAINSDGPRGCIADIQTTEPMTMESARQCIRRVSSLRKQPHDD